MPFASYSDWDACIVDQKSRGKTAIAARRICGKLQSEHEEKEKSMTTDAQEQPAEVADGKFDIECEFTKRVEEPDFTYVSGPVLIPETVDGQGDIVSAEEIKKSAFQFMMDLQQGSKEGGNFMHSQALEDDDAMFVESYLLPAKRVIKGTNFPRGTWFLGAIVWNADLRKRLKSGEIKGFSIGGRGRSVEEPASD